MSLFSLLLSVGSTILLTSFGGTVGLFSKGRYPIGDNIIMEMWLKEHLGILFDFQNFGVLNLLAIPLLIYFIATIRKRKRWELALALVFILSCALLGIKGRGWLRYILTLYPFILAVILLLAWDLLKNKKSFVKIIFFVLCLFAVFTNFFHYRNVYAQYWKYKVTRENDPFPYGLLNYINSIDDLGSDSSILVLAEPFFYYAYYYHTDKRGFAYSDPRMDTYYEKWRNPEVALDILKNQLKIEYIFLDREFIQSFPRFRTLSNILFSACELVYQEKGGYLYKLRSIDFDKEEYRDLFVNDSLLRNGSFENWSQGLLEGPDFFEGGDADREENDVKFGQFSAKITGDNFNFSQDLADPLEFREKSITCFVWVKTEVPNKYRVQIFDDKNSSFSERHLGNGKWELLQVNHDVHPTAEMVKVRIIQAAQTGNAEDVVYVDSALMVLGNWNSFYQYKLNQIPISH
jgi:hypothetical protein